VKGENACMLANTTTIGERIAELREKQGLKRQALSDELGVMFPFDKISRSAIEQLEKGITEPRANTVLRLSQFFGVSADYLLTGASAENLGSFRELGLTDTALAFWESQVDLANNAGKFAEFSATASALMSNLGFFNLFWGLINLNNELADIDGQIKKVLEENPKPKDIKKDSPQELLYEMTLSKLLEPLRERRDLLKLRYLRQFEKVFENLIAKGGGE